MEAPEPRPMTDRECLQQVAKSLGLQLTDNPEDRAGYCDGPFGITIGSGETNNGHVRFTFDSDDKLTSHGIYR